MVPPFLAFIGLCHTFNKSSLLLHLETHGKDSLDLVVDRIGRFDMGISEVLQESDHVSGGKRVWNRTLWSLFWRRGFGCGWGSFIIRLHRFINLNFGSPFLTMPIARIGFLISHFAYCMAG